MSGFFDKLRRQVWFHHEDEEASNQPNASGPHGADAEDDGYLLVGQTLSERTTVCAQDFPKNSGPNAPPTYHQVSSDLPSYDNVLNGGCVVLSGPSMFNSVSLTPADTQQTVLHRHQLSPVSDIPFELHPTLRIRQGIGSIFDGVDLVPKQFDWGKYSHNFDHEHLCLRELNSDRAADLSDFSYTSTSLSPNVYDRGSNNEDLMTF